MPRLRDRRFSVDMMRLNPLRNASVLRPLRAGWPLLRLAGSQWNRHEAMRLSAALAFYSVLSIAPLVILTITLTGLIVGVSTAQQQVLTQVRSLLGAEGEHAVRTMIVHARNLNATSIASVLGIVALLFGASQVFAELHSALNRIWEVDRSRTSGLMALLRERFLSFGLVLSIGLLLLVSLLLSAALAAVGKWAGSWLPLPEWMLHLVALLISLIGTSAVFALIFQYIPETRTRWRSVWIGAIATACVFALGKLLIGLYLGKVGLGSAYGAAGSLVVVVAWVYYSSLIFFFGAEFTHALARSRAPHAAK